MQKQNMWHVLNDKKEKKKEVRIGDNQALLDAQ